MYRKVYVKNNLIAEYLLFGSDLGFTMFVLAISTTESARRRRIFTPPSVALGYLLSPPTSMTFLSFGMPLTTCFVKILGKVINDLPSLGTATEFLLLLEIKRGHHMDELIIGVQAH